MKTIKQIRGLDKLENIAGIVEMWLIRFPCIHIRVRRYRMSVLGWEVHGIYEE